MLAYYTAIAVLPLVLGRAVPPDFGRRTDYHTTCLAIQSAISPASAVFFPGSPSYVNDTNHWVSNMIQASACSVEPGTAADVSTILKIVGKTSTPFGVKSGGHSTNFGFASTLGVQITLTRLNSTIYDPVSKTVSLGPGQTWEVVYQELFPHGVTVLGGRVSGVGVGGFLLGGGYAWLSNRYGLAIDNLVGYELVLPTGEIVSVTAETQPDLMFGLKGGSNTFGIVTKFIAKAYPIGLVWGGLMTYTGADVIPLVSAAIADFQANNTNVDANVVCTYVHAVGGLPTYQILTFNNGPTPKPGTFDKFLAIPRSFEDIATRTYPELIKAASVIYLNPSALRGFIHTAPLANLTMPVLNAIINQTDIYAAPGQFSTGSVITVAIEPFIASSVLRPDPTLTAYPHNKYLSPLGLAWLWPDAAEDAKALKDIDAAALAMAAAARADGQILDDLAVYNNYALPGLPLKELFSGNVQRLETLQKKYDPNDVMGLTGGFF